MGELVAQPSRHVAPVDGVRVGPALAEHRVQHADHRAAQLELGVVPRRVRAVRLRHRQRLRITGMARVVAAVVAQVDAAGEGHVELRPPRVAQDNQLLVVRARPAYPPVQQHLAAGLGDVVTQLAVLLLAVADVIGVRAPQQALHHHAPPSRAGEQLAERRPIRAHQLVRVAAPVGEEQVIARLERFDLVDEPVEVGRTVYPRDGEVALGPRQAFPRRIAPLLRREEPVREVHPRSVDARAAAATPAPGAASDRSTALGWRA